MGGMAAQIPIKNNPEVNNAAIAKVMHPPAESVPRQLCFAVLPTSLIQCIGSRQTVFAVPVFCCLCERTHDCHLLWGVYSWKSMTLSCKMLGE